MSSLEKTNFDMTHKVFWKIQNGTVEERLKHSPSSVSVTQPAADSDVPVVLFVALSSFASCAEGYYAFEWPPVTKLCKMFNKKYTIVLTGGFN